MCEVEMAATATRNAFIEGNLGPVNEPVIFDEFTFEKIKMEECLGRVCKRICRSLNEQKKDTEKFLCVCVPVYNESKDDLMKTIMSVMENIDFIKHKIRFNNDKQGNIYQEEFKALRPVIVPIFDGVDAMDASMSTWLNNDFPGLLEDMDKPSCPKDIHVRAASLPWWYYCADALVIDDSEAQISNVSSDGRPFSFRKGAAATSSDISLRPTSKRIPFSSFAEEGTEEEEEVDNHYLKFQLIPIVKKTNHRKHNSHHW